MTACGTDELPAGYSVIHGAAAGFRLALTDADGANATVEFAEALDAGGLKTPLEATSTEPQRTAVVVAESGSARKDVLVTSDEQALSADTLTAGDSVMLYQRVWGQSLDISVTSDEGTAQEFTGLSASSVPVAAATDKYVVNVAGRDVTLTGGFGPDGAERTIADIKFLVVVKPPVDQSDAYALLGIAAGSEARPAAVLRGTPAP